MAVAVLATSGCAERRLVSAPAEPPGTGTWVAVWFAGVIAAAVVGVLLTLPAWRERGGARFAATLFTLEAGAVAVTGVVLMGVAIRSWHLIDRPVDAPPAETLIRLSRADGDTEFFALMILTVAVFGGALVWLLALGARFARQADVGERLAACAVLGVQLGVATYLAVRLVLGAGGWPFVGGALGVAPLIVAIATCWPPRSHAGLRDSAQ